MKTTLIAIFIAAAALPVAAQSTPRVEPRQEVPAMESKAKADGKVTPRERARLANEQNRQSKKIAKQKHDKQRKAPAS